MRRASDVPCQAPRQPSLAATHYDVHVLDIRVGVQRVMVREVLEHYKCK